ncbi:serine hydrolase domain-containing protein [Mangrovivirga cuniculi]|uniref:Beta-lactamase-related domain-containing protein n=1 Tax=Mangrovivirga cuniculi TaxID=2715131 RepID=A0A4D7KBP3_9BACT|nr:serine hydrolase domain-containing protein [Mangrovivirga cuniculi]QCK16888.1 hypothetical protein DCC35_20200 [Mangrovivirga cuniculi]
MKAYIFFFLTAIFFTDCERNQRENNRLLNLQDQLDSLILLKNKQGLFDGTVVIGGKKVERFERAIGTADRSWGITMKQNFVFDIASLNKSFIASLIMVAEEEGKLNTSDKLVDHLESFDYKGKFSDEITIHQLLTHTSGLPNYDGVSEELRKDNFLKLKRSNFSNNEYVDFISQLDSVASPGKKFHYSNFAYHLLPIILENIYQKSFNQLLQEKICTPLELERTLSVTNNKIIIEDLVGAYEFNADAGEYQKNDFIDLTLGRRIFSSAEDLYLWGQSLNENTFLSEPSLKKIKTNHLSGINNDISYGYGWAIFDGNGEYKFGDLSVDNKYIIHGGNTGGYQSILVNVNEGELIISILSNIGDKSNLLELASTIVKIYNLNNHEI